MRKLWFQDEMVLPGLILEELTEKLAETKNITKGEARRAFEDEVKSKVNIYEPIWENIPKQELKPLTSGKKVRFIKMLMEFELEPDKKAEFLETRYHAYVFSKNEINGSPTVYDIFPKDLYDGEPRKIHLAFKPEITILETSVSVGEISADLQTGRIEPVIVGYYGEQKKRPHWVFSPDTKVLKGIKSMWMVLEIPETLTEFKMRCSIEADLKTKSGIFSLKSKTSLSDLTPTLTIHLE